MTKQQATIIKEKKYLTLALFALLGLVVAYVYVVSATVLHVVVREDAEARVVALQSEISQLEATYMAAQHEISKDIALKQGFHEVKNKVFIDTRATTLVLSNN